jgi:hypothetical protein
MKKYKVKDAFLAELRKIPIIQVAAEKTGLSRQSIYRWKNEDEEFSKLMEEALTEGEALVNDMSESQLLSLIKEKNFPAVRFWLNHRSPKFRERIEIDGAVKIINEISPHQKEQIGKALENAKLLLKPQNNHE